MHIIFAYFSTNKVIQNVVFINNKLRNQWLLQEIELSLFSMGSFVTALPWVVFNHCFWQRRFMSVEKLERIFYNPQIGISEYLPFSLIREMVRHCPRLWYLCYSIDCLFHILHCTYLQCVSTIYTEGTGTKDYHIYIKMKIRYIVLNVLVYIYI